MLAQRQKLNPDLWGDVRKALPLLALPEHYEKREVGYARGGMPVAFVDRVRALLRHPAAPRAPRSRRRSSTIALADIAVIPPRAVSRRMRGMRGSCCCARLRASSCSRRRQRRSAAGAASVYLEDLTSPELRDAIRAGATTIIVPIGGTEQNGPHMALGKHNVRAQAAGRKDRASARQRARRAGRSRTFPKAASTRRPATCAIPGRSPCPPTRIARRSKPPRAASSSPAFATSCSSATPAAIRRTTRPSRSALNREWASDAVRAHALAEYYRAADGRVPRAACSAQGYRGRRDRLARRARRHVAHAGARARARAQRPHATLRRRRRHRRSAPRQRRARHARASMLIVAQTVAAIRAAAASH